MTTGSTPPRTEYPRPDFDRSHSWQTLVGTWEFAADPGLDLADDTMTSTTAPFPDTIEVPFAWETTASGVSVQWLPRGWYRRDVTIAPGWTDQQTILRFGAVHHAARVWINGFHLADHEGGYLPFEMDITDALIDGRARIVVRVDAPIDKRFIAHGKQRSLPRDDYDSCAFTPSSGIWQPVWMESRPATHLAAITLRSNDTLDALVVDLRLDGPAADRATTTVSVEGGPVATMTGRVARLELPLPSPRRWSPQDPHLYHVRVEVWSPNGVDVVTTYTGLRVVSIQDGQFTLNGERIYLRGVLDQGYWPRTGITAPSEQAIIDDLVLAEAAGFNLVRKHLKIEDPLFAHHADRLGMLVWAEPASTGRFTPEAAARFEAQIQLMADRDTNHPSIIIWGLYNEEWGLDWDVPGDPDKQQAVRDAVAILRAADPTRPLVDNSGWAHVDGDAIDWHVYDEHPVGWAAKVSELMSGAVTGFPVSVAVDTIVDKQLMADGSRPDPVLPFLNSEFGGGYTSVQRGWNLRWQTLELRRYDRLAGYVWTELYDIEHETAGVYAADRSVKDDGGNDPAWANSDTVILLQGQPREPGVDAVVDAPTVDVTFQISHHGREAVALQIGTLWTPRLRELRRAAPFARSGLKMAPAILDVKPFQLSEPVTLTVHLPDGPAGRRLHVFAFENGTPIAHTHLDVAVA